jgi:hypothetical protein
MAAVGEEEVEEMKLMVALEQLRGEAVVSKDEPRLTEEAVDSKRLGANRLADAEVRRVVGALSCFTAGVTPAEPGPELAL